MNALRIFFVGGYLAYRALFNWIHWSMYIPTMLGGPIFQILFFAYVGRYATTRARLPQGTDASALSELNVKGLRQPVAAFVLNSVPTTDV